MPRLGTQFTVHAVDLLGMRWRSSPFVLARAVPLLARAIEELDVGPVDIVGHSMGGLIAAELAAEHPELVRRLVLAGSAGLAFEGPFAAHAARAVRAGPIMGLRSYPLAIREALALDISNVLRAAHQVVASDITEKLERIRAPTLVVWGAADPLLAASTGERLAKAVPGARFAILPSAGHNVMWDAPEAFDRVVLAFLHEREAPDEPRRSPAGDRPAVGSQPSPPARRRLVSRYVLVDGLPVHVRVGLPGRADSRPPIVLVHGFVISSRYMVPTALRLARRQRVYAPDLPGFGWSGHPSRVLDVPALAEALIRTLDALAIDRAVLVGNSLGCQIVAHAAARHPDRVAATVLVGPTFDATDRRLRIQFLRLLTDAPRERLRLWLLHVPDYVLAGPRRVLGTLRHAWRDRIERVLPRVPVPTLVVRGERDPLVPRRWARLATRLLPDGRLVELARAAHAANYSAAPALASVIESFLDELRLDERDSDAQVEDAAIRRTPRATTLPERRREAASRVSRRPRRQSPKQEAPRRVLSG